jgi:hypothetical protein
MSSLSSHPSFFLFVCLVFLSVIHHTGVNEQKTSQKSNVFCTITTCRLVINCRRFRRVCCLVLRVVLNYPEDGKRKFLWNCGNSLPNDTAYCPRRLQSSLKKNLEKTQITQRSKLFTTLSHFQALKNNILQTKSYYQVTSFNIMLQQRNVFSQHCNWYYKHTTPSYRLINVLQYCSMLRTWNKQQCYSVFH